MTSDNKHALNCVNREVDQLRITLDGLLFKHSTMPYEHELIELAIYDLNMILIRVTAAVDY